MLLDEAPHVISNSIIGVIGALTTGAIKPRVMRNNGKPVSRQPLDTDAQIVAPMQIALLPSVSPVAALPALPALRVDSRVPAPPPASPLSLLCTLLI